MRLEDQIYFGCAAWSMISPNRAAWLNHLFITNGNGYEWENGQLVDVCGTEELSDNGEPLPLDVMIERVFQQKRESERRREEHKLEVARERELHPERYPEESDERLDRLIDAAMEEMRKKREADPVAFDAEREKQRAEYEVQRRRWDDEKRYEFCVPPDIDQRVAYQTPAPGAHGGWHRWYPACEYSKIATFPDNVQDDYLRGIIEVCQLVIANPPVVDGRYETESTVNRTLTFAKQALDRATKLAQERIQ